MENHGRRQVSQGLHTLASREGSSMSLSTSFSISMVYLGAGKIISSSGVIWRKENHRKLRFYPRNHGLPFNQFYDSPGARIGLGWSRPSSKFTHQLPQDLKTLTGFLQRTWNRPTAKWFFQRPKMMNPLRHLPFGPAPRNGALPLVRNPTFGGLNLDSWMFFVIKLY